MALKLQLMGISTVHIAVALAFTARGIKTVDNTKSKVTLYMRPELHKLLKLRAVHEEMKMSELAERVLERYLLEFAGDAPVICPNCRTEFVVVPKLKSLSAKLPVGSA